MLPRRIQQIQTTSGIDVGDMVTISKTHAQATAFDFYGNVEDRDRALDARFEKAAWIVIADHGNGEYALLEEGTGVEITAPGEELTFLPQFEDEGEDEAA